MRALLNFENIVIDVQTNDFPVHSSCTWMDCDDTVKIGFRYDGTNFIDPTILSAEQIAILESTKAIKTSGNQKLLNLGLTQEEATAMTGYKPTE
jgi:hypothetical protein|tara:strand:+ start:1039 stop:1320 length:282 start_codon:yes stop_codon:yes gene_type:complete